jgi:hypothetical protein
MNAGVSVGGGLMKIVDVKMAVQNLFPLTNEMFSGII